MSVPTHFSSQHPGRPLRNLKSTRPPPSKAVTHPNSFRSSPMERLEGGFASSHDTKPAPCARPARPVNRRHVSDGQIAFRPPKVLGPVNVQSGPWRAPGAQRAAAPGPSSGLRPAKTSSRGRSSEITPAATPTMPDTYEQNGAGPSRGRRRSPAATVDSPRGRDRKVVPLANTARTSSVSTPSQRVVAQLPKTTPEMQPSSLSASGSSLSPSLSDDPCTPGPTQMIIGPPMLGLGLAYAHVGTPTGSRNHDAELSQLLALGIDLDEGGPRGIKVASGPQQGSTGGLGNSLRIGLPRAEEMMDRSERTPGRGEAGAEKASARTRTAFIRNGLSDRSARIASPRGSALDLTNIVRSNDSRASGLSISTITHHVEDGRADSRNRKLLEAQPEPTPATSPVALRERLRSTLAPQGPSAKKSAPSATTSAMADAPRQASDRPQGGSIRFTSEQVSKATRITGVKGRAKAMSFSAGDFRPRQRTPLLPAFGLQVKTVPSLSRQVTLATMNTPGGSQERAAGEAAIPSDVSGRPPAHARTNSATSILRKVQDEDLSTLQSIWSAPLQQPGQSGSGFMSPRPATTRSAATTGSFRQTLLHSGLARLGLGWANREASATLSLGDGSGKGPQRSEGKSRSIGSLEGAGVQSRSSSGQSTNVFTPPVDASADSGEWLYTRWDGKRVPITPEHRFHWDILSRRKASATGTSRSKVAVDVPATAPLTPGKRPGHLLDVDDDGRSRLVEVTDFNVGDGYFAIPVQRGLGHKRSRTHLGSMERTTSFPGAVRDSPRKISSGTGLDQLRPASRRPSFKSAMTMPSGLPTRSSRDGPLLSARGPPPPAASSQMAIAISQGPLSGGSSRKTPRRVPSSSTTRGTSPAPSTAHSLSTSFDSRMAYEAVKGEQGYVSFDHVMGLGEGEAEES